jgi:hypothetical protein
MNKYISIILLILLTLPTSQALSQKRYKLALKLTPNTSYTVDQQINQYIEQEFQGQRQRTQQNNDITYQYQIKEKDDTGFYNLVLVYKKIKYDNGQQTYDSEDSTDVNGPLAQAFGAVINSKVSMKVNQQGEVKSLTGADELIEKMLNAQSISSETIRNRLRKTFKKAFGKEALIESMQQFFHIYPEKKIKIGDSWSKQADKKAAFPSKVNVTWTLDKVKKNSGFISIKANVRPQPNTTVDLGIVTAKYDLNGTQEGSMKINMKTGWVKNSYVKQVMSGIMYLTMNNSSQEMAVDAKITTISKYTITQE